MLTEIKLPQNDKYCIVSFAKTSRIVKFIQKEDGMVIYKEWRKGKSWTCVVYMEFLI